MNYIEITPIYFKYKYRSQGATTMALQLQDLNFKKQSSSRIERYFTIVKPASTGPSEIFKALPLFYDHITLPIYLIMNFISVN